MNLPAVLFVIRWLVRDTFRQSRANGIFWLMLGVGVTAVAVCLTVGTRDLPRRPVDDVPERLTPEEAKRLGRDKLEGSGVDVIDGEVTLAFGAIRVPWKHYREDAVLFLETVVLALVADSGGILLALVWTAGFIPSVLEPSAAAVLLAKPVPRWCLLAGKYLGVVVFVAFQTTVFVGGVWLAFGLKTGVWNGTCWLALPVLLFHFAVFFSFSTLLATTTRSTVACVFGSLLFWFVCLGMNFGRQAVHTIPELESMSPLMLFLADAGYWVLPKPADLNLLLMDALGAEGEFARPFNSTALAARGAWHPELSVLTSGLSAVGLVGMAAHDFSSRDY